MSETVTPWVRCAGCGKVVRLNKPVLGDLHVCRTECEQRGHHSRLLLHDRVGPFWKRRDRWTCWDCESEVSAPISIRRLTKETE
jgi:hypothetical protein